MLMEVRKHLKVMFLSTKYAIMKEMLNKVSFISNILFMVLNNASFLILWVIVFSIKDSINGYTLNTILLLWGLSSGTYGVSHAFFFGTYKLNDQIINGKLDAYLVQPKSVLIQAIQGTSPSAFGDILYGYIMLFVSGFTPIKFLLFTLFMILGGIINTAVVVIYHSLAFWFGNVDTVADTLSSLCTQFNTYPDTIFNRGINILFYTLIPVGFISYLPLKLITDFNWLYLLYFSIGTLVVILLSVVIFNKGLKRYSSSNLMIARV